MSSNVEDRIVRMQFDGTGFEAGANKALETLEKLTGALKLDNASSGLESIKQHISGFDMGHVVNAVDTTKKAFSAWDSFVSGIFFKLGGQAVELGEKIVGKIGNALTKSAKDGFKEYEQQMKSVQTIAANSGASLETIQTNLDALNEYADKTSYVFSDMTSAIGRFTSAGIDVDDATVAIQGFFNAAALSGAGAQEASRGVYQLSQAMSAGVVKLQDWKSIENASIDTEKFRNIIMLTAKHMGVTDKKFKQAADGTISFRESLQSGWLTAEVMQEALKNLTMSTMDYENEQDGMNKLMEQLISDGYTKEQAEEIIKIATAADASAREIRTWSQMMETLGESMGSGWAKTWQLIIGDYEQSAEFFTNLSKRFSDIVDASSKARNALVEQWQKSGGRDALIGGIYNTIEVLERIIVPIKDAFVDVFGFTGEQLAVFTENVATFIERMVISEDVMKTINVTFHDVFMIIHSIIGILGNGIRIALTFGKAFFEGFFGVKSVLGSLSQDVLYPISQFLYNVHQKTDEMADRVSGWLSMFKIYWDTVNKLKSENKLSEMFSYMNQNGKNLNNSISAVVAFGKSAHSIIWDLYGTIKTFGKQLVKGISSAISSIVSVFKENKNVIIGVIINLITYAYDVYRMLKSVISVGASVAKTIWVLLKPLRVLLAFIASTTLLKIVPAIISAFVKLYTVMVDFIVKAADIYVRAYKPIRRIFIELQDIIGGFFIALYDVFASPIAQKISGFFSGIASSVSDIIPEFKGFKHSIAYYFIHPFKVLKDALVSFGGDNRVEYFKNIFKSIADTIDGPFVGAIELAKWAISGLVDLFGGPLGSAFSKVKDALTSVDWSSPFNGLKTVASSIKFENPFKNFKLPKGLSSKLDKIRERFDDLRGSTDNGRNSLKLFMKQAGAKIKTSGKNGLDWVVSHLTSSWKSLKSYFTELRSNGNSFTQNVKKVFGDIYNSLSEWIHNIANTTEGLGGAIAGGVSYIIDQLGKLPELLSSLFGKTKETVATGTEEVKTEADKFKDNQQNFWKDLFSKLPSVGEVTSGVIDFISNAKSTIFNEIRNAFTKGSSDVNNDDFKASLIDVFDFSDFEVKLPDFAAPFRDLVDQFAGILDRWPSDKFNTIITDLSTGATTLAKVGFGVSGFRFLNSLTKLNNGKGKKNADVGEFFKNFPTAMKEGMGGLGQAFGKDAAGEIHKGMTEVSTAIKEFAKSMSPFKRQAASKSFRQVAEGILLLAGALFVLSKIPAEDLNRSAEVMMKLFAVSAVLTFVAAWLAGLSKLDLTSVGIAMAGMGVGMIAMAGAIAIFTKISENRNVVVGMHNFKLVFDMLAGTMVVLMLIASLGGDLKGVASALIGLVAAITLSIIPIEILGHMPDEIFDKGSSRAVAMGSFYAIFAAVLEGISGIANPAALLAVCATLVTLVVVTTLALIPVGLFAYIPDTLYDKGFDRANKMTAIYSVIGGLLGLFSRLMGKATRATLGLIPLVAAVTLAIIPVAILGAIPEEWSIRGIAAVGWLSGIFTVLLAFLEFIGASLLTITSAAIGLTLLLVPITAMLAVVAALSLLAKYNMDGVEEAIKVLEWVVISLSAMALTGIYGGGGLFILAAGIAAVSLAFGLMGVVLGAIDFNKIANDIRNFFGQLGDIAYNGWVGFLNALRMNPVIDIFLTGIEWAAALLKGLKDTLIVESPSKATEEIGDYAFEGLILGFANRLGELLGLGENAGQEILTGLQDLPSKLATKASEAVNEFVNKLDISQFTDKIQTFANTTIDNIIDHITSPENIEKMKEAAGKVADGFVEGLFPTFCALGNGKMNEAIQEWGLTWISDVDSTFEMNSPSKLAERKGNLVLEGFAVGLGDETLLGSISTTVGTWSSAVSNGLVNLPSWVGTKAGEAKNAFLGIFTNGEQEANSAGSSMSTGVSNGIANVDTNMKNKATAGASGFVSALSSSVSKASTAANAITNKVKNAITPIIKHMRSTGTSGGNALASALSAATGKVRNAAAGIISAAKGAVTSLYSTFRGVGVNAGKGLADGMKDMIGWVSEAARRMAQAAIDKAKAVMKQNSPSKVFRDIGLGVGEGLVLGINKSIKPVTNSSGNLAEKTIDSFEGALSSAAVSIEDILDTDYNPVITPVINPTQFNYDLSMLSSRLNGGIVRDLNVGSLNYTGEIIGKFDDMAEFNKTALDQLADNAIDYNRLGISVANALINAGVHVEMDGGQLMGYIAGEISDASRMYARR